MHAVVLPPSELTETRLFSMCFITGSQHDGYYEFCNWKTMLCKTNKGALKDLLKLTKTHLSHVSFLIKLHARAQQLY